MAYRAEILLDSISPDGHRLVTMEVEFPRVVLAEFNTHRMLSRNSASSRAIPVTTQIAKIMREPFVPDEFGANRKGMQAAAPLEGARHDQARQCWLDARNEAVKQALRLMIGPAYVDEQLYYLSRNGGSFEAKVLEMVEQFQQKDPSIVGRDDLLGVHKGLTNRLLEPFMWHTVIVTATEWSNFFALRTDENAQREIRLVAELMQRAHGDSKPRPLRYGEWHAPLIQPEEREWALANPEQAAQASCARCARVSYLTHDTGTLDVAKDIGLYTGLVGNGHMSPLEHAATPMSYEELHVRRAMAAKARREGKYQRLSRLEIDQLVESTEFLGNFRGWRQYRKTVRHEDDFGKMKASAD